MTISTEVNTTAYNFSLTKASLLVEETQLFASAYLEAGSWEVARDVVRNSDPAMHWKRSTFNTKFMLIRKRLECLSAPLLERLCRHDDEASIITYIAACEYHIILQEFVLDCVREHYLLMKRVISEDDYRIYLHRKMDEHPELERIEDYTLRKVRQVMIRILVEAGILESSRRWSVMKPYISPELATVLFEEEPRYLKYLMWSDNEIQMLKP